MNRSSAYGLLLAGRCRRLRRPRGGGRARPTCTSAEVDRLATAGSPSLLPAVRWPLVVPDASLDPAQVVLQERDEEVECERARGYVHERVDSAHFALRQADDDVGDEAEADAVRDREGERHDHDRQRGGEADGEVAEVD